MSRINEMASAFMKGTCMSVIDDMTSIATKGTRMTGKPKGMVFVKALLYPRDDDYEVLTDATPEPVLVNVNTEPGVSPAVALCILEEGPMDYVPWRQLRIDLDEYERARLALAGIRPVIVTDRAIGTDATRPDGPSPVSEDAHEVRALAHMGTSDKMGVLCEHEDGRMAWSAWEDVRFTDTSGRIDLFDWDTPDDAAEGAQTHDGQDDD